MNAIARLIGSVPRLQHGQRWKPSKKKKRRDFQRLLDPCSRCYSWLKETPQCSTQASEVGEQFGGRKNFPRSHHRCQFCSVSSWVLLDWLEAFYHNHKAESAAHWSWSRHCSLDLSLLPAWDPPPLFQTSLGQSVLALTVVHYLPHQCALRGRCGAQRWTTKSSRNRATNRSTDFHSLKKRWQCAVDCFVEGGVEFVSCEVLKSIQKEKKNTHNSAFATGSFLQINLLKESFAQCSWPWLTR